jgi:hypothetical protein
MREADRQKNREASEAFQRHADAIVRAAHRAGGSARVVVRDCDGCGTPQLDGTYEKIDPEKAAEFYREVRRTQPNGSAQVVLRGAPFHLPNPWQR